MSKALIIIPTYNENKNIIDLIPAIFKAVADNEFGLQYHILVVDDNSSDGTRDAVTMFAKGFPVFMIEREKKLGLGTAYIAGFKWALQRDYQYIYEMDADWSHDPAHLLLFIRKMKEQGAACVIGSRFYEGRISVVNWDIRRLLLSFAGHRYVKTILGNMGIDDTTSGFKCFSRDAVASLALDRILSNGYIFQLELNYRLFRKKFKVIEIPIIFKDRVEGVSKLSFAVVLEGLWLPLKLKLLAFIKGDGF
jgi:dolichol-phosphate mannosyltransferase